MNIDQYNRFFFWQGPCFIVPGNDRRKKHAAAKTQAKTKAKTQGWKHENAMARQFGARTSRMARLRIRAGITPNRNFIGNGFG
ncbi:hypothetical protein [Asticcacaulis biprosthecium]|uniref:hypothetical protein n=1 Tax=Asticcacaulis biprosthecium TaxID=76891 RepID=UPI00145DA175|nr:hypothetical protein [Asticcacaulis biprosthecium]